MLNELSGFRTIFGAQGFGVPLDFFPGSISDVAEERGIRGRKPALRGVGHSRRGADDDDVRRALRLLPARHWDQRKREDQHQCQTTRHGGPFSRNDPFSKRLDISCQLF